MSNIQLHVGYIGITREGKRVEITRFSSGFSAYPWESDLEAYTDNGIYLNQATSLLDIIGPWVETPVEPQVNYNDGNWHRWDGATKCPVHKETEVEVNYIDGEGDANGGTLIANSFNWGSNDEPIVAFRVTKEYVAPVEPREFWVVPETGKCFKSAPCSYLSIHVREVI